MADLSDVADDIPIREANKALVGKADGSTYEARTVVPLDLTGAAGQMPIVYDAATSSAILQASVPVLLSGAATGFGKMLVANGAYYVDKDTKVVLSGNALPTGTDGWDGAYWLNTATGYVYGPRGEGTPGVWPSIPRRDVRIETGSDAVKRQALDFNLDLAGVDSGNDSVYAGKQPGGEPIRVLQIVNYAAIGTAGLSDGYVGLEMQLGTTTLARLVLKPHGPGANLDLAIGGKGTGKLKDLTLSPYVTEGARAAMPYWVGVPANAVVYTTANDDVVIPMTIVTPRSLGTWTTGADGVAVPETGLYEVRAFLNGRCEGGAPGAVKFSLRVNGAAVVNGPQEVYSYASVLNSFHQAVVEGGTLSLTAGDFVGVHILVLAQSVNLGFNYGSFYIRRVA